MGICEEAGVGGDWYASVPMTSCPRCHSRTLRAKHHQHHQSPTVTRCYNTCHPYFGRGSPPGEIIKNGAKVLSAWKATTSVPLIMSSSPVTHPQLELPTCLP